MCVPLCPSFSKNGKTPKKHGYGCGDAKIHQILKYRDSGVGGLDTYFLLTMYIFLCLVILYIYI